MNAPVRLPGIAFETVPRTPALTLPRMDITAFVGFATSGPVDLPVAVEDRARFRDLFGPDLPLAWDAERGRMVHACLGPAIEAFFRNGGRRAWVVRVAGPKITRHRIAIPALVRLDRGERAHAVARSPGAWARELRVAAILERERLPLGGEGAGGQLAITAGGAGRRVYALDVLGVPADLARGDLLELVFGGSGLALHLFVDGSESLARGHRLSGRVAAWTTVASDPEPVMLNEAEGLALHAELAAGSPPAALTSAYRLRFALLVRQEGREPRRLGGLAFAADHPRFFGHLPGDDDLFQLRSGRQVELRDPETLRLCAEAADPRFPLAGPPQGEAASHYLPLAMPGVVSREFLDESLPSEPLPMIEEDGLTDFGAALFLDDSLRRVASGALRLEAEHRLYLREPPARLRGLHALFPIDEVTLVAVPDAVHRGWTLDPVPAEAALGAPVLAPVAGPDADALLELHWTAVPGATGYVLQAAADADFTPATVVREVEASEVRLPVPAECRRAVHFRVRARRAGEVGPWSNGRVVLVPAFAFADCALIDPVTFALQLTLEPSGSPPGDYDLVWFPEPHGPAEVPPPHATIELQRASDADFLAPERLASEQPDRFGPVVAAAAATYYRVRARRDGVIGPWSNTLIVARGLRSAWTVKPARQFAATPLRAVHRALLRLAAARADLVALLSLPVHFRTEETLEHLDALRPPDVGGERPPEALDAGVPPLAPGETVALGHGALYHPWLVRATAGALSAPDPLPPDGAVAGMIARRSLVDGAWIAPANRGLDDVVALEPALDDAAWRQLTAAQVNLVRPDPRGFLVLNADTLSAAGEVRPLSVRRLLILLRRLALREGMAFVFEANDDDFRDRVGRQFRRFLGHLFTRGAFAGARPEEAFRVVTDASVNTAQSIEAGRFVCELRVAPARPLAFLAVRLVQTGAEELAVQEI